MKKRPILLIVITLLLAFLCISAGPNVPKELYVAPDPENPFQGTWYYVITGNSGYMHVIKDMKGSWYLKIPGVFYITNSWQKQADYIIKENDNGEYITSNGWKISVNDNILTVESTTYERVIK